MDGDNSKCKEEKKSVNHAATMEQAPEASNLAFSLSRKLND